MSSTENILNTITHDHIYRSNSESENGTEISTSTIDEDPSNRNCHHRRRSVVRTKSDIHTPADRERYCKWRASNNASCRVSRLHRRSKFDSMLQKCAEYEKANMKLKLKISVVDKVIDQLKEHLRTVVATSSNRQEKA